MTQLEHSRTPRLQHPWVVQCMKATLCLLQFSPCQTFLLLAPQLGNHSSGLLPLPITGSGITLPASTPKDQDGKSAHSKTEDIDVIREHSTLPVKPETRDSKQCWQLATVSIYLSPSPLSFHPIQPRVLPTPMTGQLWKLQWVLEIMMETPLWRSVRKTLAKAALGPIQMMTQMTHGRASSTPIQNQYLGIVSHVPDTEEATVKSAHARSFAQEGVGLL